MELLKLISLEVFENLGYVSIFGSVVDCLMIFCKKGVFCLINVLQSK